MLGNSLCSNFFLAFGIRWRQPTPRPSKLSFLSGEVSISFDRRDRAIRREIHHGIPLLSLSFRRLCRATQSLPQSGKCPEDSRKREITGAGGRGCGVSTISKPTLGVSILSLLHALNLYLSRPLLLISVISGFIISLCSYRSPPPSPHPSSCLLVFVGPRPLARPFLGTPLGSSAIYPLRCLSMDGGLLIIGRLLFPSFCR